MLLVSLYICLSFSNFALFMLICGQLFFSKSFVFACFLGPKEKKMAEKCLWWLKERDASVERKKIDSNTSEREF